MFELTKYSNNYGFKDDINYNKNCFIDDIDFGIEELIVNDNDEIKEIDKFNIYKQEKRDYWLKCNHAYNLLKILNFEDIYDFKKELKEINNNMRDNTHKYILSNWDSFCDLFNIRENKLKDKKSYYNRNFIKFINSKIKIINRQIIKKIRGVNKIIYYSIDKL